LNSAVNVRRGRRAMEDTPKGPGVVYPAGLTSGAHFSLLRTDIQARYTSYSTALNNGFLSVNEVRAKEGLPPIEGGDTYLRPLNMGPNNQPQVTK
jgi:phage portal protein BeeE